MVEITDPELSVEQVAGIRGNRRLVVTYTIRLAPGDPAIGSWIVEEATVHARRGHDAPVRPAPLSVSMRNGLRIERAGAIPRRLATDVHRIDLDVEQDWWRTDHAGGIEPIAEFPDHLVADVALRIDDTAAATAMTPVLTGSWGALGSD